MIMIDIGEFFWQIHYNFIGYAILSRSFVPSKASLAFPSKASLAKNRSTPEPCQAPRLVFQKIQPTILPSTGAFCSGLAKVPVSFMQSCIIFHPEGTAAKVFCRLE